MSIISMLITKQIKLAYLSSYTLYKLQSLGVAEEQFKIKNKLFCQSLLSITKLTNNTDLYKKR